MARRKQILICTLLMTLTAVRVLLPESAAAVRERIDALLGREESAVETVLRLGARFSPRANTRSGARELSLPAPAESPVPRFIRCSAEEAVSAGETQPVPEAVSAFLERQADFADLELPANVDLSYQELPMEWTVPVSGRGSSGFGFRLHPILGDVRFHYGTDVAAGNGETVRAFAAGTVTAAQWSDSYGWHLRIDHGSGWETLYAHCSRLLTEVGARVEAGDAVALVGATGLATGPHLHFELTRDGVYLNPEYYLDAAWES